MIYRVFIQPRAERDIWATAGNISTSPKHRCGSPEGGGLGKLG